MKKYAKKIEKPEHNLTAINAGKILQSEKRRLFHQELAKAVSVDAARQHTLKFVQNLWKK